MALGIVCMLTEAFGLDRRPFSFTTPEIVTNEVASDKSHRAIFEAHQGVNFVACHWFCSCSVVCFIVKKCHCQF